jgi:hypothetical protein
MRKQPIHLYAVFLAGVAALASESAVCMAQEGWVAVYTVNAPPVAAVDYEPALLSDEQLDQLLQPIALYPDALLAQVLPAATYVEEVMQASQWLDMYPQATDQAIDAQPWDPSVKAMAHYPTVLKMMSQNPDWTQAVGAAFINQPEDVMAMIQTLRRRAAQAGNLLTTPEQQVIMDGIVVQILPADPQIIYVPEYDIRYVYVRGPTRYQIVFRHRHIIGIWLTNSFDWRNFWLTVGTGWHHGWEYGRDRRWTRVAPPVIFTGVNRRPVEPVRWTHNRAKPLPVLPTSLRRPPVAKPVQTDVDFRARGWTTPPLTKKASAIPAGVIVPSGHTVKADPGHVAKDTPVVVKPLKPSRPNLRTPPTAPQTPLGLPTYQNPREVRRIVNRGQQSLQTHGSSTAAVVDKTPPVVIRKTPPAVVDKTPPGVVDKTPPAVIRRTPPAVVDKTPPAVTRRTPPAVVDKTPPVVTRRTPPAVVDQTPPAVTRGTPPAVVDKTPPAVTRRTPPAVVDQTPPAVTRGTPPAVLEDIAPASETKAQSDRGHKSLRR